MPNLEVGLCYLHHLCIELIFSWNSYLNSCLWSTCAILCYTVAINHSKWWINEWYVIMVFHLVPLQKEIYIARAPGRLNVMGGNAGYSGSLVLQVCSIVEKEMLASIFDFLELEIWLWKGWRMQLLLDQMLSEAWRTYFWLIVNRPMNFFCNVCNVMTAMALCTDEALCHGSYLFRVEFW